MDTSLFTPGLFFLIAGGGVLGTLARYGLQLLLQPHPGSFPRGTLAVNLLGSLVFGFLVRYLAGNDISATHLRIALTVGFCGAFTTMSSFSYETLTLLQAGRYWPASLYVAGSVGGSLLALMGGVLLANSVR